MQLSRILCIFVTAIIAIFGNITADVSPTDSANEAANTAKLASDAADNTAKLAFDAAANATKIAADARAGTA